MKNCNDMGEYNCSRLIIVIPSITRDEFSYWMKTSLDVVCNTDNTLLFKKENDYLSVFKIGENGEIKTDINFKFDNNFLTIEHESDKYSWNFKKILFLFHDGLELSEGREHIKIDDQAIQKGKDLNKLKKLIEKQKGIFKQPSSDNGTYRDLLKNIDDSELFEKIWTTDFYDHKKKLLWVLMLSILIDLKGLEEYYKKCGKFSDYIDACIDDNGRFDEINKFMTELKDYISDLSDMIPNFSTYYKQLKKLFDQEGKLNFKINEKDIETYGKKLISFLNV